ncbi:MAG: DNA-3-methyladenine glycosylase [Vampirovibrionales bacterium]|nr:DNA-3-methyladenine glycosylase [Vampirovibrionales bacterium]
MTSPPFNLSADQPLPVDFFARDTLSVARELLGCRLRARLPGHPAPLDCRIVETEAYTQDDPACHAFRKQTGRAATLFKEPGLAYVYLIYGMYYCLNVVTEPAGRAGAVLFRALQPLNDDAGALRTHGPGRLTRALGITRERHNEIDLTHPDSELTLWAADAPLPTGQPIVATGRIGISQGVDLPWRFYLAGNPWVSVPAEKTPKKWRK